MQFESAEFVKRGASRQRVQQMFSAIAAAIKEPAAVVIAKAWRHSRLAQTRKVRQHAYQDSIETIWNRHSIAPGQYVGVKKKVERIHVVIGGLFKVSPVFEHLGERVILQDVPSQVTPTCRLWQRRAKRPNEKQRHRLTLQMRVRREIRR